MAVRTFLDTSVLIAAYRGKPPQRGPCLEIMNDRDRFFIASPFLRLEIMPKAIYHQNAPEVKFYTEYFDDLVRIWITNAQAILSIALDEAERCGLAAMDALHVATAHLAKAEVLYTLERSSKPIYRTSLVRVVSLAPEEEPLPNIE